MSRSHAYAVHLTWTGARQGPVKDYAGYSRAYDLAIAGKPGFRMTDEPRLGEQPIVDPVAAIADGPWPPASVQLDAPFGFRGRRMVQLELRPFRYDETSGRISAPLALTVRVDFNRPAGASALLTGSGEPDRHVDAVLELGVAYDLR